jgi:hypothetical protein
MLLPMTGPCWLGDMLVLLAGLTLPSFTMAPICMLLAALLARLLLLLLLDAF